jgi:hypothetical protein
MNLTTNKGKNMSTFSSHGNVGEVPRMSATYWGSYFTLELKVGEHRLVSFLTPAEGESHDAFFARIQGSLKLEYFFDKIGSAEPINLRN